MKTLRPYQLAAIEAVRKAMRDGKRRVLLQLPTGGGKTLCGANIIIGTLAKGNRSLFVAHRVELINQTCGTFLDLGVQQIGVIRANDRRRDPEQPIQVASVSTLVRRARPEGIKLVFIDEAHRACAKSYMSLRETYPEAYFVGLTATPCRADGKPLGLAFDELVTGATYSQLIAEGFIVAPLVYGAPVLPDLSHVRTKGGDYNADDLEKAVNRRALIGNIIEEWTKHCGDRRTVVFAVSVAHSRAIVAMFVECGIAAEHLDGETPEVERKAILARLESGQTQVVSNCNVLTEGWDQPSCKCIVIARPTKSLAMFMQMAGRGLRPWCAACGKPCDLPGHESMVPIIIDHGGNVDRHGLPHEDREWSLSAKPKRKGTMPQKACRKCFAMIAAALMTCPHCGFVFPAPEEPKEKENLTPVELALRTLEGPEAELAWYRRLVREARAKGWFPGSVRHRFVEKWGHDPPVEWQTAMKRGLRKDKEWRVALDSRVRTTGMDPLPEDAFDAAALEAFGETAE